MSVRVEIESEDNISNKPARVVVYENGRVIQEIVGQVDLKPGADGGYYHCVTFKKKETNKK